MKLNQIFIIGNLVADAEDKVMSNGKHKQVFTLAVNDDYKTAGSDVWTKRAYFIDCFVIGKVYADLTKGRSVIINGKLITRTYEVSGVKKKYTAIEVFTLDYMYRKDSSDYETKPAVTVEEKKKQEMEETDDLPF